jgi:hypothetical protein
MWVEARERSIIIRLWCSVSGCSCGGVGGRGDGGSSDCRCRPAHGRRRAVGSFDAELTGLSKDSVEVGRILDEVDSESVACRPTGAGRVDGGGTFCAINEGSKNLVVVGHHITILICENSGKVESVGVDSLPCESLGARIGPSLGLVGRCDLICQGRCRKGKNKSNKAAHVEWGEGLQLEGERKKMT